MSLIFFLSREIYSILVENWKYPACPKASIKRESEIKMTTYLPSDSSKLPKQDICTWLMWLYSTLREMLHEIHSQFL